MLTPATIQCLWALAPTARLRATLAICMDLEAAEAAEVEAEAFHLLVCLARARFRGAHRGVEAQKLVAVAWMVAYKMTTDENYDNVVHEVWTTFHDMYPKAKSVTRASLCRTELAILLALQWRCLHHHVHPGPTPAQPTLCT